MAFLAARPDQAPFCQASLGPSSNIKLKDSCVKCANAKIKCSKDKPSCKRCSKKGWACEYSLSRRAGRAAGPKSSPPAERHGRPASRDVSKPSRTGPPSMRQTSRMQDDDYFQTASEAAAWLGASLEHDALPASSFSFDDIEWGTITPRTDSGMGILNDAYPSPPLKSPMSDASYVPDSFLDFNQDFFSMGDLNVHGTTNASSKTEYSLDTDIFTTSSRNSSGHSLARMPSNTKCSEPQTCLRTTLDPLVKLSACMPDTCTRQRGRVDPRNNSSPATDLKATATTRALSNVLDCPCSSSDDNLLALVALVILRQLAIYTAIIGSHNAQDSRGGRPTEVAGTAQTIISELHNIRRLVHSWSSCVAQLGKSKPRTASMNGLPAVNSISPTPDPGTRARSSSMMSDHSLDQLQTDLWVALNTISVGTIEMLKQ